MMQRTAPSKFALLAVVGYLVLVVAVVWSLAAARGWALAYLASEQSIDDWQTWREDVRRQQTEPGPVARRIPKSAEPPGLVLMRDYYAVCLTGALIFSSLLYWIIAWFLHGILRSSASHQPEAPARETPTGL
jgi:hypothetical protein